MVLPPVRMSDPLVSENLILQWPDDDSGADLMVVQFFIDGQAYGIPSVVERQTHLGLDRKPVLTHQPSSRYPGGGELGLCNGLFGTRNYRDGFWSGFEGTDLEAVVDLGGEVEISQISIRFYQGATAWIFLPSSVEFQVSKDGVNWKTVAVLGHNVSPAIQDRVIHDFSVVNLDIRARKVRVIGKNRGVCPDWHPGAGRPCWVFVDEIVVR